MNKSKCGKCHFNFLKKKPDFCVDGRCMDSGGVSNSLGEEHCFKERKLNIITIERRPDDYKVSMNGDKSVWECDRIADKAIIALIQTIGQDNVFPIGPYEYINPDGINYPIEYFERKFTNKSKL